PGTSRPSDGVVDLPPGDLATFRRGGGPPPGDPAVPGRPPPTPTAAARRCHPSAAPGPRTPRAPRRCRRDRGRRRRPSGGRRAPPPDEGITERQDHRPAGGDEVQREEPG